MKCPNSGQIKYQQVDRVVLREIPFFEKVCMKFYFNRRQPTQLIFARFDCIFNLELDSKATSVLYTYKDQFQYFPTIFATNAD
jgi:hypothetical protein